jgi:hypothetical protein
MIDKDMMGKGCDADAESEWDHFTARYRNNNQHEKGVECIRVMMMMMMMMMICISVFLLRSSFPLVELLKLVNIK